MSGEAYQFSAWQQAKMEQVIEAAIDEIVLRERDVSKRCDLRRQAARKIGFIATEIGSRGSKEKP